MVDKYGGIYVVDFVKVDCKFLDFTDLINYNLLKNLSV